MDTSQVSQESIKKINDLCRYLRSDMGAMFVESMASFLSELPEQLVKDTEAAPLADQQDYLDIITLLRREKDQIHLGMNAAMTICIEEFTHYVENIDKATTPQDIENLSLIATDDIEVSIMIEGLAARVASKISDTMNDAYLRIKQLVPPLQQSTQLPCHPRTLIQAMLDSMATLSLNTKQKIILSGLFAPKIDASRLGEVIEHAFSAASIPEFDKTIKNIAHDSSSIDQSISDQPTDDRNPNNKTNIPTNGSITNTQFPSLKQSVVNSNSSNTAESYESSSFEPHDMSSFQDMPQAGQGIVPETSGRVFNNANELLQQLGNLKALRQQMASMPVTPEPKHPLVPEQTIETQALDGLLSEIQQEQPTDSIRENTSIQSVGEIRNEIRNRLKSDENSVQTIQDKDGDVINLVSLMFDYILDNPNLPTAMKALLARLQIPMLRVAILTPSFFSESNHPARQLLDQLSKSGISWDKANDKDTYYDKLESIVFRVLKEFRDDISIFDRLLEELNEFLIEQAKLSERIINRTKTTEEKRAQTEVSKNYIQKQLNERLIGKKLPFAVIKILQNGWWHVLYHTFVRHGRESNQWKNALKIVDALVWSVIPPVSNKDQWLNQVNKTQLKIIDNLRKGLTQVNFDPMQRAQLLKEIEKIHSDVLKERVIAQVNVALDTTQTTEEALTKDFKTTVDHERANAESEVVQSSLKAGDKVDRTTNIIDQKEPSVILPKDISTESNNAQENSPVDPASRDIVKNMKNGTWVEFKANTVNPERCKLVAKIRALDKLVFTNRRGIKVAEIGQSKLARQLSNGNARIIEEENSVVDNALNSVLNDLDKMESTSESA